MASKAIAIPEPAQTATPRLVVRDAAGAIDFYKKAFGAREVMRLVGPGTKIGHAEILIGNSSVMLSDEFPDYGALSPDSLGGSPVKIKLYHEDVDALVRQAVAAGAKIVRPVEDQFYGERSGQIMDPFGYTWMISTRTEVLSADEMQRRLDNLTKQEAEPAPKPPESAKAERPVREGFTTVTPYIIVNEALELVEFVKTVFGAEEKYRGIGSAGGYHCEVLLGDSKLMLGGGGKWRGTPSPTALHVYVKNTDEVYRRALEAGAASLHAPEDMFYGERGAGVKDPFGNHWYIATFKGETYFREGFPIVQPYLHPLRAEPVVNFLRRAFGAREFGRSASPDGVIHHTTVRIGDATLEMGEAQGPYQPMPTTFFLYVSDADAWYKRAIGAGAMSVFEPADQPYGDRVGGVKDPFGNTWYIATHIKNVNQ